MPGLLHDGALAVILRQPFTQSESAMADAEVELLIPTDDVEAPEVSIVIPAMN